MTDHTELDGTLEFVDELRGDMDIGGVSVVCNYDYEALRNRPSIEGHVLSGDSTIQQIGVGTLSVQEIEKILYKID